MNLITIQVVHNNNKLFTVAYRPGMTILELINQQFLDPKKEGIPNLCNKGACRSCTIKIIDKAELLAEATKGEQRALAVGRTAMALGYRLACKCYFKAAPEERTT
ncbi:2Fe-2S iron-sulfur cluster binding domain-containing protein [Paenibacillus alginolyticus]|uniref:2Fe-2S iron-sulfur cluster binding domain-containing protein n=1 Tax=Paenibacillus alginolyticus TaxID=59839 RepID=A0ABT4GLR1_9BACL|nr:2Fe-2S iron-sulfur cluster binding domain-containing protein [Paenibacillus alginolyticus]MCY9697156.1 2Fe-2S iron-sulfur cluster binding domain-containing protein [Paenibacillus alginolyticus]MEC0148383.1 2Fe-2S iron-sulfur cluster binding domain-containing protein [Paenibacillus alginolyticus]